MSPSVNDYLAQTWVNDNNDTAAKSDVHRRHTARVENADPLLVEEEPSVMTEAAVTNTLASHMQLEPESSTGAEAELEDSASPATSILANDGNFLKRMKQLEKEPTAQAQSTDYSTLSRQATPSFYGYNAQAYAAQAHYNYNYQVSPSLAISEVSSCHLI